jgi:hypothetical protein
MLGQDSKHLDWGQAKLKNGLSLIIILFTLIITYVIHR